MRTVLFHRKYRRFHGGHLKVWHYFNHALATPGYDARVLFDEGTTWDRSNPWSGSLDRVVDSVDAVTPDLLFVAGRDWQRIEALGLLERELPIINLIQHMRHASESSIQNQYLDRRAIRICVSDEVARAVSEAGSQGPVVVIPNAVDVPTASADAEVERTTDVFIAGLKQPGMARRLEDRLRTRGRRIEVAMDHVDRTEFLDAMRRANVTLFLPNEEEGFYLPALEGMALGTIVVCPDCVGNRSYCLPDHNAFRPAYDFEALVDAAEAALNMRAADAELMHSRAVATARAHSPEAERAAFMTVLENLDPLWSGS